MARKKQRAKALELPANGYGPVMVINYNAMIVRDFFVFMSPSAATNEWAAATIMYAPYFRDDALKPNSTRMVNPNHESANNTAGNRKVWLFYVKDQVLGKKFKDTMKMGWNDGLARLVNEPMTPASADGETDVDFSFQGMRPTSQSDVKKYLFSDQVVAMVRKGNVAEPCALLFKWGYYLTMEGCTSSWSETTTSHYIYNRKYHVMLTEGCKGKKDCSAHSLHRIGRKMASNSFLQTIRVMQRQYWGFTLQTNHVIGGASEGGNTQVVNLEPYLPERVKRDMHRKDGCRFLIKWVDKGNLSTKDMLDRRIGDLVAWAQHNHLTQLEVEDALVMCYDKGEDDSEEEEESDEDGEEGNPDSERETEVDMPELGTWTSPAVARTVDNDALIDAAAKGKTRRSPRRVGNDALLDGATKGKRGGSSKVGKSSRTDKCVQDFFGESPATRTSPRRKVSTIII